MNWFRFELRELLMKELILLWRREKIRLHSRRPYASFTWQKNISKFSLQCQILGRVGLVRQYYSIWYWLMFLTRRIGKLPICRVIPRRLMAHGFLVLFCGFKDHQEITGFLVVSWKVTSWLGPLFCTRWLLAPRIQGVCEWRCAHRLLRCVFLTPSSDVRSPDRHCFSAAGQQDVSIGCEANANPPLEFLR